MIKRSKIAKVRVRSKTTNSSSLEAAKLFNAAVTKTIFKHHLTPSNTQLYKLCDRLREDGFDFAALIIEGAIGCSEHVTNSTYILGGLTVLGLYKCEILPTPSQVKELDKKYHGRKIMGRIV